MNKQIRNIIKIFALIIINLLENLILQNYNKKIKTFEFLIENQFNNFQKNETINLDYENISFAVIKRTSCPICGLFSNYIVYLGCLRKFMIQGFIPSFDFESYKNFINGFSDNPLRENPWEYYFNQPFGFRYKDVIQKGKNIKYFECIGDEKRPNGDIFLSKESMNYWHNMANKYIPIKDEIIKQSNDIIKKLFKETRNVLGVLLRGTDYIARKPPTHPIPPETKDVIKLLDYKNKYDWVFLATEDRNIRQEFISAIGIKIKCLLNKFEIFYNYTTKDFLSNNIDFKRNREFNKNYLLNIIILSKCIDFISARTSGAIGVFILSKGFRNYNVYNLGYYK
jgi:hypothetical protein